MNLWAGGGGRVSMEHMGRCIGWGERKMGGSYIRCYGVYEN